MSDLKARFEQAAKDVHALAEPTKLEQLQRDFKTETKDVKAETKKVQSLQRC